MLNGYKDSLKIERIPNLNQIFILNLLNQLDNDTFLHCIRVGELLNKFGQFLELPEHQVNKLRFIGYIHDIGKINIPNSILTKCGSLTEFEWKLIKNHGIFGYTILSNFIEDQDVLKGVRFHHENLNGTGYEGLKDNQIDVNTRLVRIIDSFDVITNDRCYKKQNSIEHALNELQKSSGTVYDKNLVNHFVSFMKI